MTEHREHPDRLTDLLRRTAPAVPFDAAGTRSRIERATRRTALTRAGVTWALRAAAAAAFFALGTWYAGRAATEIGLRQLGRIESLDPIDAPSLASLPLAIQQNGSGYLASLATFSEMRDQLSPEEREMARQVAISVLAGAIAELAAAGDGGLPPEILRTVRVHGAAPSPSPEGIR